jgi:hypothetical protein
MKIREGAYYRTRGGYVVGPMKRAEIFDEVLFWAGHYFFRWRDDGTFHKDDPPDMDLISEVYVSDTPPDAPLPDIITDQPCKTLRDEFAMEAMKLLIPRHERREETLAEFAYRQADAMMEARKK